MNKKYCLTKKDVLIILIITLVYSIIALYNLGYMYAPQTAEELTAGTPAVIDLGTDRNISEIRFYLGPRELSQDRTLTVTAASDDGTEVYSSTLENGSVFCWSEITDIDVYGRFVTFSTNDSLYITEAAVYSGDTLLTPVSGSAMLFDEQEFIPRLPSYRSGTYFDEIYHARTAYEFLHKLPVYEWTHPPLGKIFISFGVKLFGMTPFGWRISGTLFGILMIPAIYVFLKKMFGNFLLCTCGTLLFTFDFMHFAQTRIATIDVYVTFFIMLMYLFMYRYYTADFSISVKKSTYFPLIPCGIAAGLAIASKWTGIYAAAGLAILFFITFARHFRDNKSQFQKYSVKIILFCVLMFGLVPILIYAVSYIPYVRCMQDGLGAIIKNQTDMLTYHGKTVVSATHAYSSPWYKWPLDLRPIWYYTGENGTRTENISSFGNPAVWWAGAAAFLFCVYDALRRKNKNARFLVIAYLSQLVPWIPVTRITFIYHYFPCVPFMILMICHAAGRLNAKRTLIALTVIAVILFAAFYPVISGYPVPHEYVTEFLRWLPSWQLAP